MTRTLLSAVVGALVAAAVLTLAPVNADNSGQPTPYDLWQNQYLHDAPTLTPGADDPVTINDDRYRVVTASVDTPLRARSWRVEAADGTQLAAVVTASPHYVKPSKLTQLLEDMATSGDHPAGAAGVLDWLGSNAHRACVNGTLCTARTVLVVAGPSGVNLDGARIVGTP